MKTRCSLLESAISHDITLSHSDMALVQFNILNFYNLKNSLKKSWHSVIWGSPIDKACPIIIDKPAGNTFSILHPDAEVLLPVPAEEIQKHNDEVCTCQKKCSLHHGYIKH